MTEVIREIEQAELMLGAVSMCISIPLKSSKIAIFTVVSGVSFILQQWRCDFQSTSRNGGSWWIPERRGLFGPPPPGRCKMPPPSCRVHDSSSTSEWNVSWQSWAFEDGRDQNHCENWSGKNRTKQLYHFLYFFLYYMRDFLQMFPKVVQHLSPWLGCFAKLR